MQQNRNQNSERNAKRTGGAGKGTGRIPARKETDFSAEGYLKENCRFFHLQDTAGQEFSFHYHTFDKLVFHLAGKVDYIVENVTYPLVPGSILLVKNHSVHKALIDRSLPYERIILYLSHSYYTALFPRENLMGLFDTAAEREQCLLLPDAEETGNLHGLLNRLEVLDKDNAPGADALRDCAVTELLVFIGRLLRRSNSETETGELSGNQKIRDTLRYIGEHPGEDITVDELSRRVFLSRYHFMRLFKQETGETVHAYIRQRRLLYAARLIREGMDTASAAEQSGFGDYSGFSRAFTESFGFRPSELKK